MHNTYRPSILKYPTKVKIVGKGWCFQSHFFDEKRARSPTVFISLLKSALYFLQYM